jgi:hypothetical protein
VLRRLDRGQQRRSGDVIDVGYVADLHPAAVEDQRQPERGAHPDPATTQLYGLALTTCGLP